MAAVIKRSLDGIGIRSLRVFVSVADSQSFSAAGRQLRLSASSVTNHVIALERILGLALFHRTTRMVSITPAGARFYSKAKKILDQVDEALHVVVPQSMLTGHLRVAASPAFATAFIAPNMDKFFNEQSGVTMELYAKTEKPNMIFEGIDVAFLLRDVVDEDSYSDIIGEIPRAFCASPSYLSRYGTPRNPDELTKHFCLGSVIAGKIEPWAIRDGKTIRYLHLNGRFATDNGAIQRFACRSGAGIGNFYRFQVEEELRNGDLVELLREYQVTTNKIYVVTPHREIIHPIVKIFISFVKNIYEDFTHRYKKNSEL